MERMGGNRGEPRRFGGESESATGRAAARGESNLRRILATQPDLRVFAPPDNVASAKSVLRQLPGFLARNQHLLDELATAQGAAGPDNVAMLVVRDLPLVLIDNGSSITALAPVLSCTRSAI